MMMIIFVDYYHLIKHIDSFEIIILLLNIIITLFKFYF